MTFEEIELKLANLIREELDEKVIITSYEPYKYISIERFMARFGDAELNYQSLIEHQNTVESWIDVFEKWKEEGIIS